MEGDVVSNFRKALIGVKPFAYEGCIRIFHPHQGVLTIHHQDKLQIDFLSPPIIKGVRGEAGLWQFPITNSPIPDGNQPYSTGNTQTDPHT